jgi:hypothetical protein
VKFETAVAVWVNDAIAIAIAIAINAVVDVAVQ